MLYFMFNKPTGCVTARSDKTHRTVMDYVKDSLAGEYSNEVIETLFPIGRLDVDTEGLLLITDDGQLCNQLMLPSMHVDKKYFFWAFGSLDSEAIDSMRAGVDIGRNTSLIKKGQLEVVLEDYYSNVIDTVHGDKHSYVHTSPNQRIVCGYLTINDGCKHQVKRMLRAQGCYVVYLKRISIGKIYLDESLKPGECIRIDKPSVLHF